MSACAIASLRGQCNRFNRKLHHIYRSYLWTINSCKVCFHSSSMGKLHNHLRSSASFCCTIKYRCAVALNPSSLRAFTSGKVEKEREKNGTVGAKKQLKTEDIFRILSLAKPEYKSLAGNLENNALNSYANKWGDILKYVVDNQIH